jgi:hypothetical protein
MIEHLMSSSLSGDHQGCAAGFIRLHVRALRSHQWLIARVVVCATGAVHTDIVLQVGARDVDLPLWLRGRRQPDTETSRGCSPASPAAWAAAPRRRKGKPLDSRRGQPRASSIRVISVLLSHALTPGSGLLYKCGFLKGGKPHAHVAKGIYSRGSWQCRR